MYGLCFVVLFVGLTYAVIFTMQVCMDLQLPLCSWCLTVALCNFRVVYFKGFNGDCDSGFECTRVLLSKMVSWTTPYCSMLFPCRLSRISATMWASSYVYVAPSLTAVPCSVACDGHRACPVQRRVDLNVQHAHEDHLRVVRRGAGAMGPPSSCAGTVRCCCRPKGRGSEMKGVLGGGAMTMCDNHTRGTLGEVPAGCPETLWHEYSRYCAL